MSKSTVIGVIVVLVVVAGGGVFLATRNSSDTKTTNTTSSTSTNSSSSSKTPTATAANKVSISNFAFSPASITVKKGTTVTWTNNDSVAHTVTENDGQNGPSSGNMDPGKSFVFTFDNPGTYKYHCAYHSGMTGTVTVTE